MKLENNWKYKTLEYLEKENCNDTTSDLNKELDNIRKIPLHLLKLEDLIFLIDHNISLKYIIPLAIKSLKKDVMVMSNISFITLLEEVIMMDKSYWECNKEIWKSVMNLIDTNYSYILKEVKTKIGQMEMENAIANFRKINRV